MTTLSLQQVDQYVRGAGFTGQSEYLADAIAIAESGYSDSAGTLYDNPNAYNPETAAGTAPGKGSYGMFQIYLTAHPQYDPSKLYQPAYNAAAAYQVSSAGQNWEPWTTYQKGTAQALLPQVESQLGAAPTPSLGGPQTLTSSASANNGVCIPPTEQFNVGAWIAYFQCLATSNANGAPAAGNVAANTAGAIWGSFLSLVGPLLERTGFFLLALVLIVFGIVLVAYEPAKEGVGKALEAAKTAAEVGA